MSTQATLLDPTSRPPVPEDQVRLYRSEESINCPYTDVAVLHAQGGSILTNEHMMIKAAKKRAGKVGANGVVLGSINEPSAGAKVAGAIFGVGTERRGELLAVWVEPCREPEEGNDEMQSADAEAEIGDDEFVEAPDPD